MCVQTLSVKNFCKFSAKAREKIDALLEREGGGKREGEEVKRDGVR
jgi:hypothetical protein